MEFENGTKMAGIASKKAESQAHGSATILAIGTANPPNCYNQATYPDYYFRVTNSEHKFDLKNKFKRFCEKSMVKKRFLTLTEEMLRANPNIVDPTVPSLNKRLDLDTSEVPKIGAEAARKAIKEWGQPTSKITHLVFHSSSGMALPGADYQLVKILELDPSVKRFLLCPLGCYAGVSALRLAKDLAENNPGARVLVVCSEVTVSCFHPPSSDHMGMLVGHAIFGEGAGAAIVGAEVNTTTERSLYQIVSASQTFVPDTEDDVGGLFRENGLIYRISKKLTTVVADNFDKCVVEAFKPIVGTISDWNSLFWAVHPGGPAILNRIEAKLGLNDDKLRASRHVLSEYGNMWSSTVFFVLDEMRKRSLDEGKTTTGEGLQWGVLLGFGPGVTVETIVLHSVPQPQLANPVTI